MMNQLYSPPKQQCCRAEIFALLNYTLKRYVALCFQHTMRSAPERWQCTFAESSSSSECIPAAATLDDARCDRCSARCKCNRSWACFRGRCGSMGHAGARVPSNRAGRVGQLPQVLDTVASRYHCTAPERIHYARVMVGHSRPNRDTRSVRRTQAAPCRDTSGSRTVGGRRGHVAAPHSHPLAAASEDRHRQ
eukprot:IDg12620t1